MLRTGNWLEAQAVNIQLETNWNVSIATKGSLYIPQIQWINTCWSSSNDYNIRSATRSHFPYAVSVSAIFLHCLQAESAIFEAWYYLARRSFVRQFQPLRNLASSCTTTMNSSRHSEFHCHIDKELTTFTSVNSVNSDYMSNAAAVQNKQIIHYANLQ